MRRLNSIKIVYKKELLDTVRDRRTIISMIIVPVLIFPLLTIGFSAFAASMMEKSAGEVHPVAIVGAKNAPRLAEMVGDSPKVTVLASDSVERDVSDKTIRAALVIPEGFEQKLRAMDSTGVIIVFNAAEAKSEFAAGKLDDIVAAYCQEVLEGRLLANNLNPRIIRPFEVVRENLAEEKMGTFVLAMILPYVIIILSMVGATYTAIDLTAGEKERGTLETILVSPVPRWQLATGKFLTILTASIVSTLLAVASMSLTAAIGLKGAGPFGNVLGLKISLTSIIIVVLMMIPTACLFSGLLMSVSLFARSYKEAQSYISPLMLLLIPPALVSFLPGVELNFESALIPLVNISLVLKETLMGNVKPLYLAIVFISAVVYAGVGIFISHRLFEKESVMFRS